jgi:predicted ATP-dependent endonuclease of OLD family
VRRNQTTHDSHIKSVDSGAISKRLSSATNEEMLPPDAFAARVYQALNPQINEIFFCSNLVLVEGISDVAYLSTWLLLTDRWSEFRRLGGHIVPVGGKGNLLRPLAIAQYLSIPTFCMFDSDGDEKNEQKRIVHEKDNAAILQLCGITEPSPFPNDVYCSPYLTQWPIDIEQSIRSSLKPADWDKAFGRARKQLGNPSGDFKKNPVFIAEILRQFHSSKTSIDLLDSTCENIQKFCKAGN